MKRTTRQGCWIRKEKRIAIYRRDEFKCAYCGTEVIVGAHVSIENAATLDHLVAYERGGSNHETNLTTACATCNSSRQDLPLRSWYLRLSDRGINVKAVQRTIRNRKRRQLVKEAH